MSARDPMIDIRIRISRRLVIAVAIIFALWLALMALWMALQTLGGTGHK